MKRGPPSRHLLENPFIRPCWTAETAHPTANVRVGGSARIVNTRNLDLTALPTSPHLPAPSLPSAHFGPLAVADMVGSLWSHNACSLQQATRDLYSNTTSGRLAEVNLRRALLSATSPNTKAGATVGRTGVVSLSTLLYKLSSLSSLGR
jgi:hypothetical protein